nr:hypothetical protein [Tanacetum cinerariifolium]
MLVAMPFHNLEIRDSNYPPLGVYIESRFSVNSEPVELLTENDEFLRTIDENMKRIIKEQVKSQVKEQVSRILPRIKQSVNAQLEVEVLTRSSHSSRTSYAVVADLSEMELKKILIEKIEGNKSIQRSDEQRNLYKALVDAYEPDKTILDSYGETVILKRRHDDADELYRDVDINQGRGLQLSQDIEDSHGTLNPVNPDGQQESSSVSLQFVTSMLNPTSDAGMESIFTTASSPVAPLKTSTPIMTPSTIAIIPTISHAPIPPTTISSEVLQNLPTFDSVVPPCSS